MKLKVYVVGNDVDYATFLYAYKIVNSVEDADLVIFTGGADVSPLYYNQLKHKTTSCYPKRDEYEVKMFKKCVELGLPIIGICRGYRVASFV